MKTFKFNKNIVEYEDDCKFDGNEFVKSVYDHQNTILKSIFNVFSYGIGFFIGITLASKKNK